MRIVSGEFKGRKILTPDGNNTRPTSDRVREAIFNLLAHNPDMPDVEGARVIDLFAGSGALGFEALSRGADFCLFVDIAAGARGIIRSNIESFGLYGNTRIHRRSAVDLGQKPAGVGQPFNLIFLDPPYGKELVLPALRQVESGGWLEDGAFAVIETPMDEDPDAPNWTKLDQRDYGETRVTYMRYQAS